MTTLDALIDRFMRQARAVNKNDEESEKNLASFAKAVLAEAAGLDDVSSYLGAAMYGKQPTGEQYVRMARLASTLNHDLMNGLTGRKCPCPKTMAVLWGAMTAGWHHSPDEHRGEMHTLLASATLYHMNPDEENAAGHAVVEQLKKCARQDLLLELLTAVEEPNWLVAERAMHALINRTEGVASFVFVAECLKAVEPPSAYQNRENKRYQYIKAACAEAIGQIDKLVLTVESLNFSRASTRPSASEPPHRRFRMSTPHEFEYSWHTSSPEAMYQANRAHYDCWLDEAAGFVERSIPPESRKGFTIKLLIHFVKHEECWGNKADRDIFPPTVETLERVI